MTFCGMWQRFALSSAAAHAFGVPPPWPPPSPTGRVLWGRRTLLRFFSLWPPEFLCRRSAVRQAGRSLRPAEARPQSGFYWGAGSWWGSLTSWPPEFARSSQSSARASPQPRKPSPASVETKIRKTNDYYRFSTRQRLYHKKKLSLFRYSQNVANLWLLQRFIPAGSNPRM